MSSERCDNSLHATTSQSKFDQARRNSLHFCLLTVAQETSTAWYDTLTNHKPHRLLTLYLLCSLRRTCYSMSAKQELAHRTRTLHRISQQQKVTRMQYGAANGQNYQEEIPSSLQAQRIIPSSSGEDGRGWLEPLCEAQLSPVTFRNPLSGAKPMRTLVPPKSLGIVGIDTDPSEEGAQFLVTSSLDSVISRFSMSGEAEGRKELGPGALLSYPS